MEKLKKLFICISTPAWVAGIAAVGSLPLQDVLYLFLATLVMTGSETAGLIPEPA